MIPANDSSGNKIILFLKRMEKLHKIFAIKRFSPSNQILVLIFQSVPFRPGSTLKNG